LRSLVQPSLSGGVRAFGIKPRPLNAIGVFEQGEPLGILAGTGDVVRALEQALLAHGMNVESMHSRLPPR